MDLPAHTPGRAQSDLAFRAAGVPRDVAFETMGTDLIAGLVRQNLAMSLLSPDAVAAGEDLRLIPVTDGPTRIQYLAWSDFNPSPAARAFLDVVTERRGEAPPTHSHVPDRPTHSHVPDRRWKRWSAAGTGDHGLGGCFEARDAGSSEAYWRLRRTTMT